MSEVFLTKLISKLPAFYKIAKLIFTKISNKTIKRLFEIPDETMNYAVIDLNSDENFRHKKSRSATFFP